MRRRVTRGSRMTGMASGAAVVALLWGCGGLATVAPEGEPEGEEGADAGAGGGNAPMADAGGSGGSGGSGGDGGTGAAAHAGGGPGNYCDETCEGTMRGACMVTQQECLAICREASSGWSDGTKAAFAECVNMALCHLTLQDCVGVPLPDPKPIRPASPAEHECGGELCPGPGVE